MTGSDTDYMRRAIALARGAVGRTGDNPAVGCVIVRDGVIKGEGVTGPQGRPHAEEVALGQAGDAARGATVYVTLEPCGARSSGGPSCAERLAAAGVTRVVVACEDASTFAAGRGAQALQAAGVVFDLGLLAEDASALYAGYKPAGRG